MTPFIQQMERNHSVPDFRRIRTKQFFKYRMQRRRVWSTVWPRSRPILMWLRNRVSRL